jgi:hypothetical protein
MVTRLLFPLSLLSLFLLLYHHRWLLRLSANALIIPLAKVIAAVTWLGEPTDMDEVECIVANLVFDGHIKGYISHQKSCLVLREKDPFPKKDN